MIPLFAAACMAATPTRYTVVRDKGVLWYKTPKGEKFFSMGVCVVDQGEKQSDFNRDNPGYASYRYYPSDDAWGRDTLARLKSWGFNTVGAWSDFGTLGPIPSPGIYYTPILHIGSSAGAPWKDMWDPAVTDLMDEVARDQIKAFQGDARVIGYFSDNEQGWWNGALFDWGFKTPGTRSHLVALLKTNYPSWDAVGKDFSANGAASFDDLQTKGRLWLKPGSQGIRFVHRYIRLLADRYYSLCRQIIKKYDSGALYLGDRYISNFYPEVVEEAGKYVDVLSTNLNADWNDGSLARFYLPTLETLSGKPVMITEYYAASTENRSGNKNNSSGFPVAPTQKARAEVFRTTTEELLHTPYVVGAHWFQYYDEPKNGRGDGEDYDMGLVDIDNKPYEALTETAAQLKPEVDHIPVKPDPDVRSGVPVLAEEVKDDLAKWPRQQSFVPPSGNKREQRGDLYLGWTGQELCFAAYWDEDRFFEALYPDGKVPQEDQPQISITVNGHQPILTTLSAEREKNAAVIKLTAPQCGLDHFAIGQEISINVVLETRGRAYRMNWRGRYRLRQ